jgi:sec-independent protein translocase protein TatB
MFEVGFTEIVLILGLALLVLGPEKLPGLAQKVGRWTGRARAMARQLRTQLEHEVTMEELAKSRPMQSAPSSTEPAAESQTAHTDPAPESTAHTDPAPDADAPHAGPDPQQAAAHVGDADAATAPKQ